MLNAATLRVIMVCLASTGAALVVLVLRSAPQAPATIAPITIDAPPAETARRMPRVQPQHWHAQLWRPLTDPPPPPAPPAPPPPPIRARLLAIGQSNGELTATLSSPTDGIVRLGIGGQLGRLRITAIDPDAGTVSVEQAGRQQQLALGQ